MIALTLLEDWLATVGIWMTVVSGILGPILVITYTGWLEWVRNALTEIDATKVALGLKPEPSGCSTKRGKVASAEAELLTSPLTQRRCVAYLVRKGMAVGDGVVVLDKYFPAGESIPFTLEDGTRVVVSDFFWFSPGSDALRAVIRPRDLPAETSEEFGPFGSWILGESRRARYVEWILPLGAACSISGAGVPSPEYRGVQELRVKDAQISLLPQEDESVENLLGRDHDRFTVLSRALPRRRTIAIVTSILLFFGGIGLCWLDIELSRAGPVEWKWR